MEDNDSNVSETIKLIAENKGSTWVWNWDDLGVGLLPRATRNPWFFGSCQDADIILRKYYSLSSSVVRDDVSNDSSAKREEFE